MRSLLLVASLSFFVLPVAAQADSLRCGSNLVGDGSSKVETLRKCGEPISKDVRTVVETTKVKEKDERLEVTQERSVVKTFEDWTYNFGPNSFLQVVTFENGRLKKVRSGEYGF